MKNLFEYLRCLSEDSSRIQELHEFQQYWKRVNPNYNVPNILQLRKVYGYANCDIYSDNDYFYVINEHDQCIEKCIDFDEIKTELTEKKIIIM